MAERATPCKSIEHEMDFLSNILRPFDDEFGEFTCDGDTLTGRIYIHDGDDSSAIPGEPNLIGQDLGFNESAHNFL